jgi:hypothetical protein
MRKFIAISVLVFLLILGLDTSIIAQNEIDYCGIGMYKNTFSNGVYYGFYIEIGGDALKNTLWVLITNPNGKMMWLKNTFGLTKFEFDTYHTSLMSYEEFENRFPEGEYSVILWPSMWNVTVNKTYTFPQTPVITYPSDGATGVPLNPTITWEPLVDIDYLSLDISAEGLDASISLLTAATSYKIPSGLLRPNTQYRIELEAGIVGDYQSSRLIYFTTGS